MNTGMQIKSPTGGMPAGSLREDGCFLFGNSHQETLKASEKHNPLAQVMTLWTSDT
jgi:hypothetical protein